MHSDKIKLRSFLTTLYFAGDVGVRCSKRPASSIFKILGRGDFKMSKLFMIASLILLTSCVSNQVTREDMLKITYSGERPTTQKMITLLKQNLENTLVDPYSAKAKCGVVRKGYARALTGPNHYGYFSLCQVNAKNRLGGYVGYKPYAVVVNNGKYRVLSLYDGYGTFVRGEDHDYID